MGGIMKTLITLLVVVLVPALWFLTKDSADAAATETVSQTDDIEDATVVALAWLAVVDEGQYGQSWTDAASIFRLAIGQTDWIEQVRGVRQPLGAVSSRERVDAQYTNALPQAPEGEYVVLQFRTSFAGMVGATETVTPMKDSDGSWRVAGYYIR